VRDCIAAVVRDRPNALVVDYFARDGTTFHATCLLNAEDGGQRRCIVVAHNEVDEATAARLHKQGHHKGDPEYDAFGLFERVTRPRCEAVVTGLRRDGTPIPGKHVNGRPFRDGFAENVEFFRLDYLDPVEVELWRRHHELLPPLWLAAGGVGEREPDCQRKAFSLPADSRYAVLFRESCFGDFRKALDRRPDGTHVWLVTDSEEAFAEMRAELPPRLYVSMLYRDYLRNFRINTERNL
jgi:adenine-specific DNA-methyltransferase